MAIQIGKNSRIEDYMEIIGQIFEALFLYNINVCSLYKWPPRQAVSVHPTELLQMLWRIKRFLGCLLLLSYLAWTLRNNELLMFDANNCCSQYHLISDC